MRHLVPMRHLPRKHQYKNGDVLVLFGELFQRGYANGLVDEAEKAGLTIVRATVGRRTREGELRPLTEEEMTAIPRPFINIPLEAGFDLEPCSTGETPCDLLKDIKLTHWQETELDFQKIKESQQKGQERFKSHLQKFVAELTPHIPKGANVIFAHLMAGGVPRAKIILSLMNRIFKGSGDRHLPSEIFWNSPIGQFCAMNFLEVSSETFKYLIDATNDLRQQIEGGGGTCRYLAYGYHGTDVLIGQQFLWQTYTPYLQGWAKMRLENHSREAFERGIKAAVFNCPEILTNSSSIFVGVEVSLYPLLGALEKHRGLPQIQKILDECRSLLKPEYDFASVLKHTTDYLNSATIKEHCNFEKWPQHSSREQMEKMLESSNDLVNMHISEKNLMTAVLSEAVFKASGTLMFSESFRIQEPVWWLGHDIIAEQLAHE